MSTTQSSDAALEDSKIPVKFKLAALWTSVMFCYVYGDIFKLMQPGVMETFIAGTVASGGPLTQGILLAMAASMAIPSTMVFLSLALRSNINRWVNIIFGGVYTAFLLVTTIGAWHFYILLAVVETILTLLIVWYAWKWPKHVAT